MSKNAIRNITRGGQTFLHNWRMIAQVLNKAVLWMLPVGLLAGFIGFMLITTSYERSIGQQWGWAQCYLFFDGKHHQQLFQQQDGSTIKVYSTQIIHAPFVKEALDKLSDKALRSLWVGIIAYALSLIIVVGWLKRRGDQQSQPKHIKGDYLGSVDDIKKIQCEKSERAVLKMGSQQLPLPFFSEVQHFLFHGTTGSGKSSGIRELLYQIRERGERALVYDKSCNFVEEFYQAKDDHLMNPFDECGVAWSLWKECLVQVQRFR
jgi:hypothetical protein